LYKSAYRLGSLRLCRQFAEVGLPIKWLGNRLEDAELVDEAMLKGGFEGITITHSRDAEPQAAILDRWVSSEVNAS
jgi:hypothetical protein